MKIVRIITRLNIGGPSIHVAILSTGLDPEKFSTWLVTGCVEATEGDLTDAVARSPVQLVRMNTLRRRLHPWGDAATLVRVLRLTWSVRPQVIHTHMAKAGALGRLAGWLYNTIGPGRRPGARATLVHTFHGHVLEGYFAPPVAWLFTRIERWLAARTDILIAVNQAIQDGLIRKGIGHPRQWRVIPLGLDLATLAQLPFPNVSSTVRVGLIGRLVPIKNSSLFLQGLSRLIHHRPDQSVRGVIVGDGPLRAALEREAKQLGVDGIVRFLGWQRDLRAVYEDLDVACLTSWNEGTPVSLIEAMAAGRTVIATDVGGVRDLLSDRGEPTMPILPGTFQLVQRGILIRAGDASGLAAALRCVHEDVTLRTRLAEAARPYVVQMFSQARLLRDLTALYEEGRRMPSVVS